MRSTTPFHFPRTEDEDMSARAASTSPVGPPTLPGNTTYGTPVSAPDALSNRQVVLPGDQLATGIQHGQIAPLERRVDRLPQPLGRPASVEHVAHVDLAGARAHVVGTQQVLD